MLRFRTKHLEQVFCYCGTLSLHQMPLASFLDIFTFLHNRHDELVSEGGVYANMWLQQQKAEEKEQLGSNTDSTEEERDEEGA